MNSKLESNAALPLIYPVIAQWVFPSDSQSCDWLYSHPIHR